MSEPVDVVLTAMSTAMAERMLAGVPGESDDWAPDYPLADELDAVRAFLATQDGSAERATFGLSVIRDPGTGTAIGGIGFFGPPDADGVVEIGYGIVPSMRRRGLATAAVRQALRIAAEHGATAVRADTTTSNVASIGVLRRAGMVESHRGDEAVFFEVALSREDAAAPQVAGE